MSCAPNKKLAVVLKGYPRLSETFIAQEILELERRGLQMIIVSLRQPTDTRRHPVHDEIKSPVYYLPEYLYREPLRVLRAWRQVRRWPLYKKLRSTWLKDLVRDPTPNRGRRFGQALVLASELRTKVDRLHAHFLHTPSSVTRYAALLCALPWSASAHAKDIWTTPDWEKREKLSACEWLVTCTAANRDHLAALAPPGRVELVYHGLDLGRFPAPSVPRIPASGRSESDPITILSVCRLVEKKGMDVLLRALAQLPASLHWRLIHVGGGPLKDRLRQLAVELGIAPRITWRGALTQDQLLPVYRDAEIFALASRIARDGDRDGLPNVLMEAQSQALACIATSVSAIPELIEHEHTGLLVKPESVEALARALERLIADPLRRTRLAAAGKARVTAEFSMQANIERLAAKFGVGEVRSSAPRVARR
jgi:glycosyltransferase involved in cell wall biosynthesis